MTGSFDLLKSLKKLEGNNLFLRKLRLSDAPIIKELANDKVVTRFTTLPSPYSLDDAINFIKKSHNSLRKKSDYSFAIVLKEKKELIGIISLMKINYNNKNAELGYWIGRKYWCNGFAKEAVKLMLDFAFKELKLKRVYAFVLTPNIASFKVLEKTGFKKEGLLRKALFRRNKWYDEFLYSILQEEFKKL